MFEIVLLPLLVVLGLTYAFTSLSPLGEDNGLISGDSASGDEATERYGDNADVTTGTDGNDVIYMGGGNDFASGGAGDDRIFLEDGFDRTADGTYNNMETFDPSNFTGDDLIRGGGSNDFVYDSVGSNELYGGLGDDRVVGVDHGSSSGTADELFGGMGKDTLTGDDGDIMSGGGGEDSFEVYDAPNRDAVRITDFEDGETLLILDGRDDPADLSRVTSASVNGGADTMVSLDGSAVALLVGVNNPSDGFIANPTIFGNGDDSTTGTDKIDTLWMGEGNDYATGSAGNDEIFLDGGFDRTADGTYVNTATFAPELFAGDDVIHGGALGDFVFDSVGSNELYGDFGNDRVVGVDDASDRGTPDELYGGPGDDVITGDDGDIMTGGKGLDAFEVYDAPDREPVMIRQFGEDETLLILDAREDPAELDRITVTSTNFGADTLVSLDGNAVAILVGISTPPVGFLTNT